MDKTPKQRRFQKKKLTNASNFNLHLFKNSHRPINLLILCKNDPEAIEGFMDSLSKHELSIMNECQHDYHKLRELKDRVEFDLDNTAKQLAMDG